MGLGHGYFYIRALCLGPTVCEGIHEVTDRAQGKGQQEKFMRLLIKAIGADESLSSPWVVGTKDLRKSSKRLRKLLIDAGWKPPA